MSASERASSSRVLGVVVASATAIGALLVVTNPTTQVRLGLTLLLPAAAIMAFFGSWQQGTCPRCRARPKFQERTELPPEVSPGSRARAEDGEVDIELGWQVTLTETISCSSCGHRYSSADDVFVSREAARTPSEAVLLAQAESKIP